MLRLLYWLYESRVRRQIRLRPVPRHVGIILDGNRRYAREHGLADPRAAYDLGAEKLDDMLAWCSDLGIPAVTLWVCSIDNLKRQQGEVAIILAAVEAKISGLANDPAIHRHRVRVATALRARDLDGALGGVVDAHGTIRDDQPDNAGQARWPCSGWGLCEVAGALVGASRKATSHKPDGTKPRAGQPLWGKRGAVSVFEALFALRGLAGGDRRVVRRRRGEDLGALWKRGHEAVAAESGRRGAATVRSLIAGGSAVWASDRGRSET